MKGIVTNKKEREQKRREFLIMIPVLHAFPL